MDLPAFFAQVADPRRAQGQRHPLSALLWLIFLATASGYVGYRKISQFGRCNAAFFTDYFALSHGLPSHVSIRKLLQALDKKALAHAFSQCFNAQATAGDWLAGDGQSLRSTVQAAQEAGQTFVSVVSLYAQRTGLTVALQDYTDKKTGELVLLRELLSAFQDRGVVLTLDALHAQKKQPPLS
jgi:hypothetical protein